VAVSCRHGNETPGLIKGEDFFDLMKDYLLLKRTLVLRSDLLVW
jgi:hypothetical protein